MRDKRGEEAFNSITHKLSQLPIGQTQGFIYRAHEHFRKVNNEAYEPEIVAIGPYHRGKDNYKMMEKHKLHYLQLLLERKKESSPQIYISAIEELEQEARNCYAEPISLSPDKFIEMLVLDGCFIIELVRKATMIYTRSQNDPIFYTEWIIPSLQRDLILFENQIPFFVLCKLFDLIEVPNQHSRLIYLLLSFCQRLFPGAGYRRATSRSSDDIKHILDLIYFCIIPESFDGAIRIDIDSVSYVEESGRGPFIHSAAELGDANVKFYWRKSCESLFEVKFQNGTIMMPPLTIEDRTECFFTNLIAYEQHSSIDEQRYITDYVSFLDHLIDYPKDVDILSRYGIIDNRLGDQKMIVNIFNQLRGTVSSPRMHFVYGETFKDINAYCNKRWNRWMAPYNQYYFSNPWALISFWTAVVALLLTIAQTVCSVLQVF